MEIHFYSLKQSGIKIRNEMENVMGVIGIESTDLMRASKDKMCICLNGRVNSMEFWRYEVYCMWK